MERPDVSGALEPPEVRIGEPSDVIEMLAADLEAYVAHAARERFTLAIPGGSVATRCFPRLAALPLDWSKIEFFWVDERAVTPMHDQSNYASAVRAWLGPAAVPAARIHRMAGEGADLERAAREYEAELTGVAGNPPRLDYVLLGVGSDGHVASLFPGHRALRETRPVLAITDAPSPLPRRLTLSLPVLTRAARVVVVAFGRSKSQVLREALSDPASTLPVARIAREAPGCLFLLDRDAGSAGQRTI